MDKALEANFPYKNQPALVVQVALALRGDERLAC